MNQTERKDAGLIYDPQVPELMEEQTRRLELLYEFNQTRPSQWEKRQELMQKMFGSLGKGCYLEPPFHANWGGMNVFLGDNVYGNFNLTLVDDGRIYVGDNVMFGPNVTVATPNHPILPLLRGPRPLQYNRDVHIGKNVWIGANSVILPGVTIGENTVVGAGSVVVKDLPSNVVAVGNPCHVMRPIGKRDEEFYFRQEAIDWENLPPRH
ncbi:MAG: sugar O-acetyltransferase [Oligosphaeraceae bacterium]